MEADLNQFYKSIELGPSEVITVQGQEAHQANDACENEYCRLCATRASNDIIKSFACPNDYLFSQVSRLNIGVRRDDGLPQVVCTNCMQRLETIENFIQSAASAQTVLTAMFLPEQLKQCRELASSFDECCEDDTSSGEEIFGGGKIKREKTKDASNKIILTKIKMSTDPAIPETASLDSKQPVKSNDPCIKLWSNYLCCKRCGFRSESIKDIREHSWQNHDRCVVFRCTECPGQTSTFTRFIRHMIRHFKSLEQCCEFCNGTFASEWDVILHKGIDHKDETSPHKCSRCGCAFKTELQLRNHQDTFCIVKSKGARGRRSKCNICDKEFLNYITLRSHMDTHDPRKNACDLCNKVYKNKYILSQHREFVHSDIIRYICQVCGKGFKIKQHLKRHVDVHNDVRPYSCDTCEKKFRSRSQLKCHQSSHSEESAFSCHLCAKSYKFRAGLRDHMRAHSKAPDNSTQYACDCCEMTFLSWSNCDKHMKSIHKRDMSFV